MAYIYLDPSVGSDANDGLTASTPVRTLLRAVWQATSGDEILVSGTTITSPLRGQVTVPAGVKIRSATRGTPFWHSGCDNISHGAIVNHETHAGVFTANYTDWGSGGTGGTPAIDTNEQLFGAGCLALETTADYIRRTVYLSVSNTLATMRKCRYRIVYKMSAAQYNLQMRVETTVAAAQSATAGRYCFDFQTETWKDSDTFTKTNVVDSDGNLANSTTWAEVVTPWFGPSNSFTGDGNASSGQFHYLYTSGGIAYIQSIQLEYEMAWTETATPRVYRAPFLVSTGYLNAVTGRTSAYHSGTAISGLFYATDQSDYTTYRISEGNAATSPPTQDLCSYYATAAGFVEFKIPTGQAITDYTLLFAHGIYAWLFTGATGGGEVIDCNVICSQRAAYGDASNSASWKLRNFREYVSLMEVAEKGSGTIEWIGGGSWQPIVSPSAKYYGGGVLAGVDADNTKTGTVIARGIHVQNAGDDAFQPIGIGTVEVYGCTEDGAAGNGVELNCSHAGTFIAKGFTTTGAIRDQSAAATTITLEGVVTALLDLNNNARVTSTITIGDGVYSEAAAVQYTGFAAPYASNAELGAAVLAANATLANINFSYTPDYDTDTLVPNAASVLIGTGSKWWTGPNPRGANGEPFSDWDTDCGGVQTRYGVFHPGYTAE